MRLFRELQDKCDMKNVLVCEFRKNLPIEHLSAGSQGLYIPDMELISPHMSEISEFMLKIKKA